MNEIALGLITAGLAAVGVFNVLMAFGDALGGLVTRTLLFARRPIARLWEERETEPESFDPHGLDRVPWEGVRVVAAGIGVVMAALLFWERNPYLSVLGLAGGYAPSMVRAYLLRRSRRRVAAQVRHFLRTLRGTVSAYGGLHPALTTLVGVQKGVLGERLALHLKSGGEAVDVLRALAADLRSDPLTRLAERLVEAREGMDAPERVVEDVLEQMEREAYREAKEAVGSAPVRLLIPMLILMVPPVLVLTLYPPVARLLTLIAGAGEPPGW